MINTSIRKLINYGLECGLIEKEDACENTECEKAASTEYCNDIGQATKHLKTVADELCRSLGDFMDKLSEKGLFDTSVQDELTEEAAEGDEKEMPGLVDGILASISYLDVNKGSAEKVVEKAEAAKETNVSEILSGFSFLN